jgi:DMSO/TMAO reductase YedYZ molybdopterin-dependent catalytic subunit
MKRIIFAAFAAILLILTGCAAKNPDGVSSATAQRYRENEITEYKGAKLDPAVGPRDNSIKGVQKVNNETYRLTIDGLVQTPLALKYEEVLRLDAYERKITLHCVEGWEATILWKGVLIGDLLKQAGVKDGAVTVIFSSVDGYTTSLPLKTVLDRQLILGYGANGLPLPPEMGYPFIVVAEDKLGYKWGRWVTSITLSSDPNYKGYYERLGYGNDADVTK